MTKVSTTVEKVTKPAAKFGAGTAGLIGGAFVASKIPELSFLMNIPVVGKYLAKLTPGAAVMFLAFMLNSRFKNELIKAGAFGMGLAGFANAVKRLTADIPALATINASIPAGLGDVSQGHASNTGQYPPGYYLNSNRAGTRIPNISGLGNAYALEGPGNAYNISGIGNAFQLEGR